MDDIDDTDDSDTDEIIMDDEMRSERDAIKIIIDEKINQCRQGENIIEWVNEFIKHSRIKYLFFELIIRVLFIENTWAPCVKLFEYLINNGDPRIIRGACEGYVSEQIVRNKANDLFMMLVNKCNISQNYKFESYYYDNFRVAVIHNSQPIMEYYMNQYGSKKDVLNGYVILGAFLNGKNKFFTRWLKTLLRNEDFYISHPYIIVDIIKSVAKNSEYEETNRSSTINNAISWCIKHNMFINYNLDDILISVCEWTTHGNVRRAFLYKWYKCYEDILDGFDIREIPEIFVRLIKSFRYFVLKRGINIPFIQLNTKIFTPENVDVLIMAFRDGRVSDIPNNWVAGINCFPKIIRHNVFEYFVSTRPIGKNEFHRFVKLNKNAPQFKTLCLFIGHPNFSLGYWQSLPLGDRKMFVQKLCVMNNTYDITKPDGITNVIDNILKVDFNNDVYDLISELYHVNLGDMIKALHSSFTHQPIYESVTEAYVSMIIEDFIYYHAK